jgi:transketolase
VGAPENQGPKVVAFEGEFAFTEGHAQELKTIALAQQVGKRLRLFFSYNNAGIDDALIGGVIPEKYGEQYDIANQFQSYGWNVFTLADGISPLRSLS